ncbi:MAG: hypothetical protein Q4E94_05795 [Clostridia bacterium]|nr:hypothetical protein [Clostridia bacterium]
MFEVMDVFKLGDNLSVTLNGRCDEIRNGSKLTDQKGNVYNVVSVGMTRYDEPSDMTKSTTVLIVPNTLKKGTLLYKSEELQ